MISKEAVETFSEAVYEKLNGRRGTWPKEGASIKNVYRDAVERGFEAIGVKTEGKPEATAPIPQAPAPVPTTGQVAKKPWRSSDDIAFAQDMVSRAQFDLGELSDGQRRDLLSDNTEWSETYIWEIVEQLEG